MNKFLVAFVILSMCIINEIVCHVYDETIINSEHEVIYRATRGVREKKKECHYKKGPWEECDTSTNVEKRILTLKRGDENCEQSKVYTRKCKKACKYEKGEWSECDHETNTRTRSDTLKPKSDSSCQSTRTITKKCKKVCRYNKQAPWSKCDSTTGLKTKILVLTSGDPQMCEANKKITKPCCGRKDGSKGNQDDGVYDDE